MLLSLDPDIIFVFQKLSLLDENISNQLDLSDFVLFRFNRMADMFHRVASLPHFVFDSEE